MHYSIRKWLRSDFNTIQEVLLNSWKETYLEFIPADDLENYHNEAYNNEALSALWENPETSFYIAERKGRAAGVMRISYERMSNKFYLNSLYVLSKHHGHGLGKQFLNLAIELAKEKSCGEIWLGVMKQNINALKWYKHHGFVFESEEPFRLGKTEVIHLLGYKRI